MEFIYSLFHTENCYECHYADTQRISDITIGDSWGSELSEDDIYNAVVKELEISVVVSIYAKNLDFVATTFNKAVGDWCGKTN